MRLRSNDRYFDFTGDVEMEKQSKLFEKIDETSGDFSYQFDMPKTANNMAMLGFPTPDAVKSIYKSVPCDALDTDNIPLYTGQIRVEELSDRFITCSFFSGNYNWIGLLSGNISETDFSDLDTDLSETEIINAGTNTEGIFYPLIDTGGLITRGGPNLVVQDFTGMIFLKTAFERIFSDAGIKIQGDLFNDPLYNSILISRLTVDQKSIDDRSTYANKSTDQAYILGSPFSTLPLIEKILFDDDSSFPYFDGSQNNFVSSRYTADVDMMVDVDVSIKAQYQNDNASAGDVFEIKIYVDGSEVYKARFTPPPPSPDFSTLSLKRNIRLDAGSYVEVFSYVDPAFLPTPPSFASAGFLSGSKIKITPTFLFKTFGNSMLPNWTKAKFVNNILSLFCCICDYDQASKTLTIDFFNNIKAKSQIDISEFIKVKKENTSDFLSSFAKKNLLKYADSDAEDIKKYNVRYSEPYGAGIININNDFVPDTETILDSDLKAPVSYVNTIFSASLERVDFVEMDERESTQFTSIQDSSGKSRINMADASLFTRLDLCRIKNCTVPEYNGDWIITAVSTTFIVIDKTFSTTATGDVTKIVHKYTDTEDVHLFVAATYDVANVSRFSNLVNYRLVENDYPNVSYSFFNLLNTGNQINDDYPQSVALGVVKNTLSYQRTLLDTYWGNVDNVLNDPVKLFAEGRFPKSVFLSLTPLRPIRVRSVETDNLYYLNRITGYKNSYTPCTLELIKLS